MKREFLKNLKLENGESLPDSLIEAIMSEYGKSHRNAEAMAEERSSLRSQLAELQTRLEDSEARLQNTRNWQDRCTELEQQLADLNYGNCIRRAAEGLKFSSKSAGEAFLSALKTRNLPVEQDQLQGFDCFLEEYRQNDPAAFAQEQETTPMFVRGGSGKLNDADHGLRAAFGL